MFAKYLSHRIQLEVQEFRVDSSSQDQEVQCGTKGSDDVSHSIVLPWKLENGTTHLVDDNEDQEHSEVAREAVVELEDAEQVD